MERKVALYDWDAFVYRAAFSAQKLIRHVTVIGEEHSRSSFGTAKEMDAWLEACELTRDDVEILQEIEARPVGYAIKAMQGMFERTAVLANATENELYLTGKDNFRQGVYPEYKANRTRPKPVHYEEVLDYSIHNMGAVVINGMEADDKLAIRATELDSEGINWIMVSPDKDMRTVPGVHLSPWTEVHEVVDPWHASYNFYCQCLIGDTADNIPGVYGIGEVAADKLLCNVNEPEEMYAVVKQAYEDNNLTEEELIRNARLLHMLRHEKDWWEPPNETIDM